MDQNRHFGALLAALYSMKIKLTGPSALLALVAIIAFGAFRISTAQSDMDQQGREVIRQMIVGEYLSYHHGQDAQLQPSSEEVVARDLAISALKIRDINIHGHRSPYVVKVTLEPNAYAPPGSANVRYLKMRHSLITGWSYLKTSSKFSYWLNTL